VNGKLFYGEAWYNFAGAFNPVDAAEYSDNLYAEIACAIYAIIACGNASATAAPPDPQATTHPDLFGIHAYAYRSAASDDPIYKLISCLPFISMMAAIDYELLRTQSAVSRDFWFNQPLWNGNEPEKIREWQCALSQNLRELKLNFIADDLNRLWQGQSLDNHAVNYLKDLSETITSNPDLLRKAILFGDITENIHVVRVLLLGSGGAGKSSLADLLQGKKVKKIKHLTKGVDYLKNQPLNLRKTFSVFDLDRRELDLYLWDFGGQTIFHGLHSAFLHENCVYVLVVDSRHEQAPDEWLHQIRHLAGSQAKVLLVTNWYEQCETYQNKTRLLREFPDLLTADSFFYFSCLDKDAPDFKRFVQSLVKTSLDSQKMVLKETLDVQRALDEQYKDGDTVFVRESKLRDLIATISQHPESADSTLNQLQQLGFLVQVEKGNSRYCLKPAWAVDNAYQLLYSPALRQANGILNLTALEQVFAGKVDEDHVEYLVNFLNERSLCIRLQDNGRYFFPDATRADEPLSVSELLNKQNKLTLRFDVPYLPLGFHARLVHKLFVPHSEVGIHDPQDIWRQGFILRAGTTSQAVVHYLLRKNVIEMVLTGDLKAFSALLREFYTHLKAVLVSPNGIRPEQIHPSVLFNQQSFSVHSGEGLVNVLAQINSYDQLFQEVRNMASTGNISVTNGQVIIGDGNTQKSHSDNTTITVTADQRQIISTVLDEMLEHKLPKDITKAVVKMQDVVEADAEKPTEKTQSLLSRFIGGVKQIAGFTDDASKIGEFVAKHQDDIGAVLTSIQSSL
jgi:GTPase SAR1 family protein